VRDALVAALDDWAACTQDVSQRRWVLSVGRLADPDLVRNQLRDPVAWENTAALATVAKKAPLESMGQHLVAAVGWQLRRHEYGVELLRAAYQRYPTDFWISFTLGSELMDKSPDEAVGYFLAARALRPDAVPVRINLGSSLHLLGRLDQALVEFRKATELDPNLGLAHSNLGHVLYDQGKLKEAKEEFEKAIPLDPLDSFAQCLLGYVLLEQNQLGDAEKEVRKAIERESNRESKVAYAHIALGHVLTSQGRLSDAEAEFRAATKLDPNDSDACDALGKLLLDRQKPEQALEEFRKFLEHSPKDARIHIALGNLLRSQNRLDEAEREFRTANFLDPRNARPYLALGDILLARGRFEDAKDEFRRADTLDPRGAAAEQVRRCDRFIDLTRRLPLVLKGEEKPASAAEYMEFAFLCMQRYQRYFAGASLYSRAFVRDENLANDVLSGQRFNAACAAAMAGTGQGQDAADLDDMQKAYWRKKALEWLRADLNLWAKRSQNMKQNEVVVLPVWALNLPKDLYLAAVRDPSALNKLPQDERDAWQKLWKDVDTLLGKAQEKK
jgi:serine/threonine-protein kinase